MFTILLTKQLNDDFLLIGLWKISVVL